MSYTIQGSPHAGFRVIDDKVGALTGRFPTAEEALAVAGIKDKPATAAKPAAKRAPRAAAKKPAAKPAAAPAVTVAAVTGTDES